MRIAVVAASICLGVFGLSTVTNAQAAVRKPTSIPAQGLGPALHTLAKERDFQLMYRADLIEGLRTLGVQGELTAEEAFEKLLAGTGLKHQFLDEKTVTIVSAEDAEARPTADASGLGPALYLAQSQTRQSTDSMQTVESAGSGRSSSSSSSSGYSGSEDHSAKGAGDTRGTGPARLGEIVVTAQKRQERLREVPISVSVVSGAQLEQQGASQFSDYAGYVPSLSYSKSGVPGEGEFNLRGVTTAAGASASTAIYLDEVPTTTHGSWGGSGYRPLDLAPYDLERVEVLRGPQGTLYGDSTIGGLIKYVTRSADVDAFSSMVGAEGIDVSGGEGLGGGFRAMLNAPVSPGLLGVRLSGAYQENPGYVTNPTTGEKGINASEQRGLRVALRLVPSDAFTVDAQWLHSEFEADGRAFTRLIPGTTRPAFGDHQYDVRMPEPTSLEFDLFSATARYDFGRLNLTAVTGYSRAERGFISDESALLRDWVDYLTSGTVTDGQGVQVYPITSEKFTQEVRLASAQAQPLTWLIGGYYSTEDTRTDSRVVPYRADGTIFTDLLEVYREQVEARYTDLSVFANATFKLTEEWEFSAGLRHSRITDDFHDRLVGTFLSGSQTEPYFDDIDEDYEETTWSLSSRYLFSDDLMVFARVATGFRAGGVNYTWPGADKTYDPDYLTSYEAGIRADFWADRTSIDLTIYYLDWEDLFIRGYTPDGYDFQTNGGRADGIGAEFTGTLRPASSLTLTATAAYLGLKIRDDLPTIGAVAGDRTPTSPAWSGSLLADYGVPLSGDWLLNLGGGIYWVTHTHSRFVHDPAAVRLSGYAVADLNAAVSNARWALRGYVRNLTNQDTVVSSSRPDRGVQMTPRTVGVAVDVKF